MTLHATRDGQKITIHGNTGVDLEVRNSQLAGVHIGEDAQHVRYFHSELGRLLGAADEERKAAEQQPDAEHSTPHGGHGHHGGYGTSHGGHD